MSFVFFALITSSFAADVVAPAWDGVSESDLGRLYTDQFEPLPGRLAGAPRSTPLGQIRREFRLLESSTELAASVRAWGFGNASASADTKTRYGFFRALDERSLSEWEPASITDELAEEAAYYLRGLYMGYLYEVAFSGSESAMQGAIQADLGSYGGDVSGWASANSVTYSIRGVGLQGRDGAAIFAKTESDISRAYEATGAARPILAVFAPLPRRPNATAPPPRAMTFDVVLGTVSVPAVKRSGDAWDIMGGSPDLSIWIKAGSEVLYRSPVAEDTTAYAFNTLALRGVRVTETPLLTITLADADYSEPDLIARWDVSLLEVASTGQTRILDDGNGTTLELAFGPSR